MVDPALKKVIAYLSARGCTFSGEIIGRGIYKFAIPGEGREDGRLTVGRHGQVKAWHMTSRTGLDLGSGWDSCEPIALGGRQMPAMTADVSTLTIADGMKPVARMHDPRQRQATVRKIYNDQEVSEAVGRLLTAQGWEHKFKKGGIEYWNDGTGSTPACRVHVSDGLASVWSHRSEVDLPPPFRSGRATKDGHKTMYVTGRDLELESIGTGQSVPMARQPVKESSLSPETVEFVRDSWTRGRQPSLAHPHLTKAGAQLDAGVLKQFPDTDETRKKYCAADLLVPVFRPTPSAGKLNLELVGGQRLMVKPWQGNDKLMLSGTPAAGAVVPIPPAPLMQADKASLVDWIGSLGKSRIENLPLVICEGVSTGIAIHQAGVGNVLSALSSSNLPAIAKWVKEQGIDRYFPAGVVIAADLDTGRDSSARLKSTAIPKAIEAAEIVGGRVALAPMGNPSGTDARDLLGIGGEDMVRDYINHAVLPVELHSRRDVFPPVLEKEAACLLIER